MTAAKPLSIMNYFGGKNNPQLLAWIHSKLDILPSVYHLCEPCCGSAAVTLNYKRARIRTINDLNSDVYNLFYQVRNHGEEFLKLIELTPHCRQEYESVYMNDEMSGMERARVFFLRTVQSFGNTGGQKIYNSWSYTINDSRYNCSQSTARYLSKIENLPLVINELRKIQVEHIDFRDFMRKYNSPKVVLYLDPPYVHESRSMHIKYKHEINNVDQIEMADLLKKFKGKWLLSGYHSKLYDDLFDGFSVAERGAVKTAGADAIEVLWANYDLNANKLF